MTAWLIYEILGVALDLITKGQMGDCVICCCCCCFCCWWVFLAFSRKVMRKRSVWHRVSSILPARAMAIDDCANGNGKQQKIQNVGSSQAARAVFRSLHYEPDIVSALSNFAGHCKKKRSVNGWYCLVFLAKFNTRTACMRLHDLQNKNSKLQLENIFN